MELEVGIISWLLYFIVHSDTLSVFKKSSENDSLHLELKVKFHHNLISIDNNSKPTIISDLIYKNLKFISQSKLKKSDTIMTEAETWKLVDMIKRGIITYLKMYYLLKE